jgi:hypothetical protein
VKYNSKPNITRRPLEKVQLALLSDRLKSSEEHTQLLLKKMTGDIANILGITDRGITTEMEFSGRELDLIFTINNQNTPKK